MQERLLSRIYSNVLWSITLLTLLFSVFELPALASPTPGVDLSQVPVNYCGTGGMSSYDYSLAGQAWSLPSGAEGCITGDHGDWYYAFSTARPTSYTVTCLDPYPLCDDRRVDAWYGAGGTFTLSGPDGERFTGEVMSGVASIDLTGAGYEYGTLRLSIYGEWNDGSWSYALLRGQPASDRDVPQTVNFTPEPSSLVLLGSGILGLAEVLKRKFIS